MKKGLLGREEQGRSLVLPPQQSKEHTHQAGDAAVKLQ